VSTASRSSSTDRSPPRRASTMRRRVGSASTWNTSGMTTYYFSDIYRVNNISSGGDAVEGAQVRQRLGHLLGKPIRLVAAEVDHLLGHSELEEPAAEVQQLLASVAVPAVLQRAADLGRIATDSDANFVELGDEVLDKGRVAARDVPDVGVPRDQPERGVALHADPDGRVGLLERFRVGDRVLQLVVAPVEVGALLREQRLDDL